MGNPAEDDEVGGTEVGGAIFRFANGHAYILAVK